MTVKKTLKRTTKKDNETNDIEKVNEVVDNINIYEQCKGKVSIKNNDDYISSGITLLNLAFTNNRQSAFQKKQFIHIEGLKHSGKTFMVQTIIATACYDERTKNFDIKFVDAEKADDFDHEKLYGSTYTTKVSDLFEPDEDATLDKFYDRAVKLMEVSNVPVIIVLDSLNALISELEKDLFDENIKRGESGKEKKSDYTAMKTAIVNSGGLKRLNTAMSKNGGIVIFLTQMRSNTDAQGAYAPKHKASTGGVALPHYCQYGMQMKPIKKIEEVDFDGNKHIVGYLTEIKILKNKSTGKQCSIEVPIYKDYGVDDIQANLLYLKKYNVIKGTGTLSSPWSPKEDGKIKKMYMKQLIKYIENNNLEEEVVKKVEEIWLKSELSLYQGRKKKFG